ncbi:MAG: ABC transporter permease [Paracoccaceae bacterium]|tara:strand:+ start:2025 stop:2843 length:819 start_codon:yes stop_codon:yes gene_type:complete
MARSSLFNRPFEIKRIPSFQSIALFTFVGLYGPIIILITYSFNSSASLGVFESFSFQWYVTAWENEKVQEAAFRSLYLAAIAATIATIAATMAALATTRTKKFRGMTLIFVIINQPLMIPEIVTAVALLVFFAMIKIATGYTGMLYLIIAHTAFCIPFAYLPIRARLESMDLTLETAGADLYATPWKTFQRITLPMIWPGIIAGYMLAFVISLDDVVISEFVKSAGQETLPTYMLGQLRRFITPETNAIATVNIAVSVILVSGFFLLTQRKK